MDKIDACQLEADARFPSGPWIGFYLQKEVPGRHEMELRLQFQKGTMEGEGRDRVGQFVIRGRYDTQDGKCHWTKRYVGMHDVFYQGYNEGKGIWRFWEFPVPASFISGRGGFHIWPEGMPDPTGAHLTEAADVPLHVGGSLESTAPLESEPVTAGQSTQ